VEGRMPPLATDLMLGSPLEFRHAQRLRPVLEFGLKVKIQDRPQTMSEFLKNIEDDSNFNRPLSVIARDKLYTVVEGWHLGVNHFQRDLRRFQYSDIQFIEVTQERVFDFVVSDSGLQFLTIGCGLCLIGLAVKVYLVIFIGAIILAITILTWSSTKPKLNHSQYKYYVWVFIGGEREFVDVFSNQKAAENLGKALRKASGARFYLR
jgi:hypothetical protein